jgi:hypothetical protein
MLDGTPTLPARVEDSFITLDPWSFYDFLNRQVKHPYSLIGGGKICQVMSQMVLAGKEGHHWLVVAIAHLMLHFPSTAAIAMMRFPSMI